MWSRRASELWLCQLNGFASTVATRKRLRHGMCRKCVCTVRGSPAPLAVAASRVQRCWLELLLRGRDFICAMFSASHVLWLLVATAEACSLSLLALLEARLNFSSMSGSSSLPYRLCSVIGSAIFCAADKCCFSSQPRVRAPGYGHGSPRGEVP